MRTMLRLLLPAVVSLGLASCASETESPALPSRHDLHSSADSATSEPHQDADGHNTAGADHAAPDHGGGHASHAGHVPAAHAADTGHAASSGYASQPAPQHGSQHAAHEAHAGHKPATTPPAHAVAAAPHSNSVAHASVAHATESRTPSNEEADGTSDSDDAATIFARRILPILKSDQSSSCTQCHFAGVELRDFIVEDQAQSFASLKAAGLIDVARPDDSKLLRFIARRPEKPDALVDKVRENELFAFRTWIRSAVKDPTLLAATVTTDIGTSLPPEVIRHARQDRVVASFIDNIWSEMGRCINCHSPERNRNKIGRDGFTKEDVDAISWIVPNDPAATLRRLADSGNIDIENPQTSAVLTKPAGLSDHGGGPKFFPGSQTYRNFLAFLTDYSSVVSGRYTTAGSLPAAADEIALLSEQQLRITDIPDQFSDMALQVDIYRREPSSGNVSPQRWATGFSRVNGKQHVWQNPILVTAAAGSERAGEIRRRTLLPPGDYVVRLLADRQRLTEKDPTATLAPDDIVGEVQISGEWKPGYQPPKIVQFPAK